MSNTERKKKALRWQKEQTTQYNLRFMNATGVPEALKVATKQTGKTVPEYMKTSVIQKLREDGFLQRDEIVLNLNKERHKQKIARLEQYIAQEKKKME